MTHRLRCARSCVSDGRTRRIRAFSIALCVGVLACPAFAADQPDTDVVVFMNGDKLTGEIKGLERNRLRFETDATGTIEIEWNKVATLQTVQVLHVETVDGLRYLGTAPQPVDKGQMQLQLRTQPAPTTKTLPLPQIVRIAAIDQGGLIDRLDGYVSAGYDYTNANQLQQINFTGGLKERTEQRQWQVDGSSTITTQQGQDDSSRFDVSGSYRHFRPQRRFIQGFGGFEANDELGLDLRATLGGAYGLYLQQSNEHEWAIFAGLAVTRENFSGETERESLESLFGTQYSFFRYDTPEASLDFTFNLLPSLTESGRVRSEGKLRSRYELVSDLFFEVSLYGSYDSDPGAEALSNSDYGVVTSLGYTF